MKLPEQIQDDFSYSNLRTLMMMRLRARGFSFLPNQSVGSPLVGRHGSRLRGRGLDFDELRHYRPGDDIRMLDWKVTDRTGRPHVRSYRDEREHQALLLVDQRATMFFGSQVRMKSVTAVEFAALGAWRILESGDRVGALMFNDEQIIEVKPHRSRKAVSNLLNRLVTLNHSLPAPPGTNNAGQLNRALRETNRLAKHDCLVLIVSDLDGWNSETVSSIKRLARHNDVVVSLVYDPLEQRIPGDSPMIFSDGALQIQVDSREPRLQKNFQQHFENKIEFLQGELKKHDVPVISIDTVSPVDAQLRATIGDGSRHHESRV